jgi:hypothetical protein
MNKSQTARDENFEKQLLTLLMVERRDNKISPENPITAQDICSRWNLKYNDNKTDVNVRDAVHHLCKSGEPIASNTNGYFYALSSGEWTDHCDHLIQRAKKIFIHYYNPLQKLKMMHNESLSDEMTDPVVQELLKLVIGEK